MKVIDTVAGFRAVHQETGRPLGLVPTMGCLHEGHLALVRRARSDNATVAVSIFVNPAQFGLPYDDFSTYPRDMESDLAKLREEGVDLVFAPSVDEMYPDGFETSVDVGTIANKLEGKSRPGHFTGVATVVCKLLSIVRPDRAYFGQKDAQQCLVVKRLNSDLDLGAEIVVVPTAREPDGLALSSRNAYLSPGEREAATVLYRALMGARSMRDDGVTDAETVRRGMRSLIGAEPLACIDYVSVADPDTLDELNDAGAGALASLAVHIGDTRLIDNITLEGSP
jgi:pantoate--beta-alanine ligase